MPRFVSSITGSNGEHRRKIQRARWFVGKFGTLFFFALCVSLLKLLSFEAHILGIAEEDDVPSAPERRALKNALSLHLSRVKALIKSGCTTPIDEQIQLIRDENARLQTHCAEWFSCAEEDYVFGVAAVPLHVHRNTVVMRGRDSAEIIPELGPTGSNFVVRQFDANSYKPEMRRFKTLSKRKPKIFSEKPRCVCFLADVYRFLCPKCVTNDHTADECQFDEPACIQCGNRGHHAAQCPDMLCSRCRRLGHGVSSCRARGEVCHRCGLIAGHRWINCPTLTADVRCRICDANHPTYRCRFYDDNDANLPPMQ